MTMNLFMKRLLSFYPCLIAALVAILCLAVWPMGLFGHTTYESASLEKGLFPNVNLADGSALTGEFTPAHSRLDSISFQFLTGGDAPDGTVTLELYDTMEKKLFSVTLESGDIMNYRWIKFPVGMRLTPGVAYTWRLRAYDYEDATLAIYCGSPVIGPEEAGDFYYNGIYEEKLMPATVYTYTDRIDGEHYLPYYAVFLIFGLLLFAACRKFETTNEES